MLDARVIGSYLSRLRKEADFTQVALADQLNVSHQAVSKWERGESIPDIGSLSEIAKKFNVSVDQLLNGGRKKPVGDVESLVNHIVKNRPEQAAELINTGETEMEGLVEVAPLVKTSALKKITGPIHKDRFTFEHLAQLAPFLDGETLDAMIRETERTDVNYDEIFSLAPFLKADSLFDLIEQRAKDTPAFRDIVNLAPFLGKYTERLLDDAKITNLTWQDIAAVAPFVNVGTLKRLVEETVEDPGTLQEVIDLAPFLGGKIDPFIEKVQINTLNWDEIAALAPFVQPETLSALIDEKVEGVPDVDKLSAIMPFLREHSMKILEQADLKRLEWEDLGTLAPFFQKGQLDELLEKKHPEGLNPEAVTEIAPFLKKETLREIYTKWRERKSK